nr:MAG TPA: hypothetical protein [Caudoviricetes sp.]
MNENVLYKRYSFNLQYHPTFMKFEMPCSTLVL